MKGSGVRGVIAGLSVLAGLIAPAASSASVPSVYTGLPSPPVTCTVQPAGPNAGQRWCSGSPSRVQSWDGTPIDVSVTLPPAPAAGPDGDFPLIAVFMGWASSKFTPDSDSVQRWVDDGYAVFSMTDRGWGESCGSDASRVGLPSWASCTNGNIRWADLRYEVRDAQYLIGILVDEGLVDPRKIGAQARSFGAMTASSMAVLRNRTMLTNGRLVPWRSPGGTPLSLAAATPANVPTDLISSLMPNGSTLDYAAQNPYFGPKGDKRVGVQKYTILNSLYASAQKRADAEAGPDILDLGVLGNAAGPYDSKKPYLRDFVRHHGALNISEPMAPAPMLLSGGLVDDFVGGDDLVKLYNRIRSLHPATPVAIQLGDEGHDRSQDKPAEAEFLSNAQKRWMNYYVKGEGPRPANNVQVFGITCPSSAPSTGPFTFRNWASLSAGELRLTDRSPKTIGKSGTRFGRSFSSPSGDACSKAPAGNNRATANYRMPVTRTGFDVAGSPTLLMRLNVTGRSDQLAARLLDVAPNRTEILVDRGLLRPAINAPRRVQVLQLHPNVTHIAMGHRLKLELMPDEYPYSHRNVSSPDAAAQHPIDVLALQLRVPTTQRPGGSRRQIKKPLPRYLPPGYRPAVGYRGKTTNRPPNLSGPPVRKCGGRRATIVGTPRRDVLKGTRKRDVIVGLGGPDKIFGFGGNDLICGSDGNDLVIAGPGNDRVYGQGGGDTLNGGPGRDRLFGEPGKNVEKQ